MRRSELEAKLKELGWVPAGTSGTKHEAWSHAGKSHKVYVPRVDIINVATAERIIAEAER
ncbi:MAG TPA: type II toxin-antitoxin system HicA family toxin [Kofleriaceae bacterium]